MKIATLLKTVFIANLIAASWIAMPSAKASTFDEQEIDQEQVIAIASPYRHGYNLVIIQQVPGKEQCWSEAGMSPVVVDPLLMNFNFSGHCSRATDSNGYSVRINGEEKGSDYLLKIVEQGSELVLIGTTRDPNQTPIVIGRTHGMNGGTTKIFLNPGWRFTKRSYQGKELGHFYFSQGSAVAKTPQPETQKQVTTTTTVTTTVQEVSTSQESDQLF